MKRLIPILPILSALLFALPAGAQIIIGGSGGSGSISLTTTGTTGASSLSGSVLNIPVYQGQISLTTTGSSGAATFSTNTLNIPQYQCALTLTTTGSSGAATLGGCTLNIPQYTGGGGSGTVSGQAAGVIPLGSSSTVIGAQSHCDDGVTTTGTVTCSEPIAISGSTHGFIVPAGTAPTGAAAKVVYASDATNGFAEVNENNGGLSRVCTAANAATNTGCQGASGGTVSDGAGTTTANQIAVSTTTGHIIGYKDFPETHQIITAACDGHTGSATPGTALSLPTTSFPSPTCRAGTNNLNGVLTFGASESAQFQLELPADYDASNLPFVRINYTQAAGTASLTIAYQIQVGCSSTTDDPSFATAQAFTTTTTGSTANTPYTQTLQLNSTSLTGCAGGSPMNFKIATTAGSNGSSNLQMITVTIPRQIVSQAN